MAEQYTPNLGHLCSDDARRDAVHIAVAPVIAGEMLHPGERVGLIDGKGHGGAIHPPVGIVDPFLDGYVGVGQRFWLFLFPGSITSLRHVWSHPAFVAKVPHE